MANQATTTYKVTGNQKAVSNLWNTLQRMEVNSRNIWLDDLAKHYGIDYQKKHISVRGHIYWAEYEEDEDTSLLSFETETAWDACNDLFFEINRLLDDELSISYRCCECGCEVYYTHDEGDYFPEECCVSASGEPFEDCCDDVYGTIGEAIKEWTSKTGIEQGERTDEQMMDTTALRVLRRLRRLRRDSLYQGYFAAVRREDDGGQRHGLYLDLFGFGSFDAVLHQ